MSDFKFTDEDSPPTPPNPPKKPEPSGKPSDFQFTEDSIPSPTIPSPTIPSPAIPSPAIPSPTIPSPTVQSPKAPAPKSPSPQVPIGPAPPVMNPPAGQPQTRPSGGTVPGGAGASQSQAQAQGAGQPRPASKPIPIPTPSVQANVEELAHSGSEREGAPQDDFSFKLWSMGQTFKGILDALEGPASWLLRVGLVIGITALAYVLAGTILGKAGNLQGNPHAADLTRNLTLATQALMTSLLAVGIATILLGYEDNRLGFVVGGVGVLCHFVVPIVLKKFVGDSSATAAMAPIFRHFGYYLVMIGLVKGLFDTAVWLWNLPETIKTKYASVGVSNQAEAKQRIIAREANMLSPCWRLPFCRESIRKQCPAFLARSTCWKFGRGCYCDEEMISRIVRGEALEAIKSPTRQSRQGKAPCGRCYIYLEHQTYKFRVLSPLALPVSVLTTWLIWPFYVKVFTVGNNALDTIWNTLSFNSSRLTPQALETSNQSIKEVANMGNSPEEVALIAQNMLGVLLGFMILIYISKFIEWAIFKAKW